MISKEIVEFLVENRDRNDKQWFHAHKDAYRQYVLNPLFELVTELTPFIKSVDQLMVCDPMVDRTISRIYRDTRFSKDKALYREEVWISFARDKKQYPMYPQFFLVIRPNYFMYGCGYYAATTDAMKSIRNLIVKRDVRFLKAIEDLKQDSIFRLEGEKYKKNMYPDQPEEFADWLNRKCVCMMYTSYDMQELYSTELAKQLVEDFSELVSLYKFLIYAEEMK